VTTDTVELLERLRGLDIRLRLDGDRLTVNAPEGALTPVLRDELARRRDEVKAHLAAQARRAPPPLERVPRLADMPVSHTQQRLWFIKQLEPDSHVYNVTSALRLTGRLDEAALQRTLASLVARHESLRTRFLSIDGTPRCAIEAHVAPALECIDLGPLEPAQRERAALEAVVAFSRRPIDIAVAPLLRCLLVREDDERHCLVFVIDHIIADGLSLGILLEDFALLYSQHCGQPVPDLPELPLQYLDYADWERRAFAQGALEDHLHYWKQQLAGLPELASLPTDRPRPAMQNSHGSRVVMQLPPELGAQLKALARSEGATFFMVLLSAFQVLMHRHSGATDLPIGSVIANRGRDEVRRVIGFFANNIVLRGDLTGNPTVGELIARNRELALGAYAHQDMPFDRLVDALAPRRALDHSPLFQVLFVLQNLSLTGFDLPALRCEQIELPVNAARFDLSVDVFDLALGLRVYFEYNAELFDEATIERLMQHYRRLLESMVRDPAARIGELPMLTDAEREHLLLACNDTAVAWPDDATLPSLFTRCAQARPAAVALSFEGATLSYGELLAQASHLARHLRTLGVGPGVLVGLCLEREPRLLVALLGVLLAGGAYVPLDPGFPAERLAYMLEDSGATVLLTAGDAAGGVDLPPGLQVLDLDAQAATLVSLDDGPLEGGAAPDDPAYVIYTSGSTGRPKGVAVPHRALANFLHAMQREPGLRADDVVAAITTISFDIAGLELYLPLVVGARIELLSRETAADGLALADSLAASGATVLQATPATWRLLLEAGWQPSPGQPLRALCGGEPLPRELADRLLERVTELWNLYGPTETTIWSTVERVLPAPAAIRIGRPIANTQVYVLSAQGEPVPAGVAGELWIGGDGVALGYHRRPELTAERFVPDRFGPRPQGRLYRTGDLARWDGEGRLHHLGRLDHQVKVRGFRIELGEIEAELAAHPAVKQTLVMARDDGSGELRLVAYLVFHAGRDLTVSDVRRHLRRRLPDYMIPSIVVAVSVMPLTPNGKIDRAALPDPFAHAERLARVHVPPAPGLEQAMARIWAEVLKVDVVGAEDNFFELGGHSLLSFKVVAAVERSTGWRMDPRILFFQTLRQVAATGAQAGAVAERS